MPDFLTMEALSGDDVERLLDRADVLKQNRLASRVLEGASVAVLFEKPSTRTRVSFEVGIVELGGTPIVLTATDLQLGRGETIEDTGRVLSRYVRALVVRTFGQERLLRLAEASEAPVVNALSDHEHPCQALADLQTLRERLGPLAGRALAYVGDGNNVAHSLMIGCATLGMRIAVATPPGYEPDAGVVARARSIAAASGGEVVLTSEAAEAVAGADAVYTDVWASMGQEAQAVERRRVFAPYQVKASLLARARPGAVVLHCLPAHRNEEITDEVIDGPASAVWDQAENRLHAQKALLEWVVDEGAG